ncbi:MAG: IclR family transcriptional regulator [Paracoccaceae bacterium]
MSTGPSTVHKALTLLDFFSVRRPEIGLSELAKLANYNKATTLRFLAALEAKGFVEQDEETRGYKLGAAFLRFSQLREASFPLADAVQVVLRDLNAATDETVLASVISGDCLANIGVVESQRLNRVIIEPGVPLPFHATASGLAYLAFAAPEIVAAALQRALKSHASKTLTDPAKVAARLDAIRQAGVAYTDGSFEEDVMGIAAPYFGPSATVYGAVASAFPSVRGASDHTAAIERHVRTAARKLTELQGGQYPDDFPRHSTH